MKGISETVFATQVEYMMRQFNWRFMHIKPSVMQSGHWASSMNKEGKGWLDYIALKELDDKFTSLIAFELKDGKRQLEPAQREWIELLVKVTGIYIFLWRPIDFDDVLLVLQAKGLPDIISVWKRNVLYVD